jgi:quercetin dioxygenase-like cupin family protein
MTQQNRFMAGLRMASKVKDKTGEKLGAKAVKLSNLADYQDGSIVSRTIIDKKTGTVTFFAFDEGQGLSEHVAPYDALVYLIDGEAEVVISGKTNHLKEGEIILIPANKVHSLKATRRFKMALIMIRA